MKSLREYISDAEMNKRAIGHFNISTLDMLHAVLRAREQVSRDVGEEIPVVIGVSEGERDFLGVGEIVAVIHSLRFEKEIPVFLNADHTYSIERAKEAIDAGFDMVVIDGVEKPYEENKEMTRSVIEHRDVTESVCIVEAEYGYIGKGSGMKDEIPEGTDALTNPDEAAAFVKDTGIDMLAPSVGNIHGIVKSGNPDLKPELVSQIRESTGVPLVLHGGSGSNEEDVISVIKAGISLIHISTEMRKVYRSTLEESLKTDNTLAPYKYMKDAQTAVAEVVVDKIKLFWGN
jgi:fructose-bisphosphate aldolase class II